MGVNILRDDPQYIIDNILRPAKDRFFLDKNQWRFSTYSYGVIQMNNGPELVDEAIEELQASGGIGFLEWDTALQYQA